MMLVGDTSFVWCTNEHYKTTQKNTPVKYEQSEKIAEGKNEQSNEK